MRSNYNVSFSYISQKNQLKRIFSGGSSGNKKLAESLQSAANQVESLTPQLVSGGSIRMNYPTSKAADEHFENLRQQYADTLIKARNLCDEATDSSDFIKASGRLQFSLFGNKYPFHHKIFFLKCKNCNLFILCHIICFNTWTIKVVPFKRKMFFHAFFFYTALVIVLFSVLFE